MTAKSRHRKRRASVYSPRWGQRVSLMIALVTAVVDVLSNTKLLSSSDGLDDVEAERTVRDSVDLAAVADRTPPGWSASTEIVQSFNNTLEEALVLSKSSSTVALIPTNHLDPEGATTAYSQESPAAPRKEMGTYATADAALSAAANLLAGADHRATGRPAVATAGEATSTETIAHA